MEQIKSRLAGLRLPGMAHCWQTLYETRKVNELSLSDGLELLLQSEEDQRTSNRCARLLKNAAFRYKASIEELSNDPARGTVTRHAAIRVYDNFTTRQTRIPHRTTNHK